MGVEIDSYLVDGRYNIRDLVDLVRLQDIMERFSRATGFSIGFLDHPGLNVLISTGWRDICTKFHRICPSSQEVCRESNHRLLDSLHEPGQLVIEPCENGLIDCATPIIIRGKHIASLATGQLLLEPPDTERFRRQACRFGYSEGLYLKALSEVPIVSQDQVRSMTSFLGSLATLISEIGLSQIEIKEKAQRLEKEVTERVRVETALRDSEEKHRALVETTGTGYVILGEDGSVFDANQEYVRLTGHSELSEILGRKVTEWTAPHDRERNDFEVRKCLAEGAVRHLEVDYVDQRNRFTPIEINATVLPSANGPKIVTLCRDISERKRAQEQRRQMETQMLHVQKLESLGLLAGGIAHDFNNLLTAVLGNSDLALMMIPEESPARPLLANILKASRQAADLCGQLLAYSGRGRFILQKFDLGNLVREMGKILEVTVSKKISVGYSFQADLPPIEADLSQVRQVLMNLIINSAEAIGENAGTITVGLTAEKFDSFSPGDGFAGETPVPGEFVSLEVADTGCGMDEATLSQIFDPFFSTKFPGRGLGLAAVQGIIRGHHGFIRVSSEKGKGTRFRVFFPANACGATVSSPIQKEKVDWKGTGIILLADDEENVRFTAAEMLKFLGFQVLLASDGREAVEIFRRTELVEGKHVVAVLLDLTMPRLDGKEALRGIRMLRSDVPIILSSGFDEQDIRKNLLKEEMAGFIQKPYQVRQLASVLQKTVPGTHFFPPTPGAGCQR